MMLNKWISMIRRFNPVRIRMDRLKLEPSAFLIGREGRIVSAQSRFGNVIFPLYRGQVVTFDVTPLENKVNGVRLRFGTFSRRNRCHLRMRVKHLEMVIPCTEIIDNQYHNVYFPAALEVEPNRSISITCHSPDAEKEDFVGIWCSRLTPNFEDQIRTPIRVPTKTAAVVAPRVSIVIPVYNKSLYTYNCLLSLFQHDIHIPKEVIVVDNASTDETSVLLKQFGELLTIIENLENKGFVSACIEGASVAKGEFLLFLNNDTQVTEGWLSSLVTLMDEKPDAGAAGSKLIYPDGKLQEAGGIIFNDASGWNYGRLQDPTLPLYNKTRPVDYCSGASLMIRKSLWDEIGGFDLRFAPAYYEDTDLCFMIREKGYQVYYCHESEVIHHEGITAGTDVTVGYKAYQEVNKTKFLQKWHDVLQQRHYAPGTSPEVAIERLAKVQKCIADVTPFELRSAKSSNCYEQLMNQEIERYRKVENVHDLPDIAHYWSNKFLVPMLQGFGFTSGDEMYFQYILHLCRDKDPGEICRVISIGAGNCDIEADIVQKVIDHGYNQLVIECLDLNEEMLNRGRQLACDKGILPYMRFVKAQVGDWIPEKDSYDIVMANHSLHHFVELEVLFGKIRYALKPEGRFLTHDMIGRNGHQRWPEALERIEAIWKTMPTRYKWNRSTGKIDENFVNWDCSAESFEGIRSQDILPLLCRTFGFELFVGFGNLIDVFIDRCYGHNFDPGNPEDLAFIDRIHQMDVELMNAGSIKPTHMIAVMTRDMSVRTKCVGGLTPEKGIRWP